jgi:hypothetical protein
VDKSKFRHNVAIGATNGVMRVVSWTAHQSKLFKGVLMKRISKFLVAGAVLISLAACATQAQPVYTDMPRPAGKPCDAKTQLESGRRVC